MFGKLRIPDAPKEFDLATSSGIFTQTALGIMRSNQYSDSAIWRERRNAQEQLAQSGSSGWYFAKLAKTFSLNTHLSPEVRAHLQRFRNVFCDVRVAMGLQPIFLDDEETVSELTVGEFNAGHLDDAFHPVPAIHQWQRRSAALIQELLQQTNAYQRGDSREIAELLLGTATQINTHVVQCAGFEQPTSTKEVKLDPIVGEVAIQVQRALLCLLYHEAERMLLSTATGDANGRPHDELRDACLRLTTVPIRSSYVEPRRDVTPAIRLEYNMIRNHLLGISNLRSELVDAICDAEHRELLPRLARRLRFFEPAGGDQSPLPPLPHGQVILVVRDQESPVFFAADGRLHYSTIAAGVQGAGKRRTKTEIWGSGAIDPPTMSNVAACIVEERGGFVAASAASRHAPLQNSEDDHHTKILRRANAQFRERLEQWEGHLPEVFDALPNVEPLILIEGNDEVTILCRTEHVSLVQSALPSPASPTDGTALLADLQLQTGSIMQAFCVRLPSTGTTGKAEHRASEHQRTLMRLTGINGHVLMRTLGRLGVSRVRQSGSHATFSLNGRSVTIMKDIQTTTESVEVGIIRQKLRGLDISLEDFLAALDS